MWLEERYNGTKFYFICEFYVNKMFTLSVPSEQSMQDW